MTPAITSGQSGPYRQGTTCGSAPLSSFGTFHPTASAYRFRIVKGYWSSCTLMSDKTPSKSSDAGMDAPTRRSLLMLGAVGAGAGAGAGASVLMRPTGEETDGRLGATYLAEATTAKPRSMKSKFDDTVSVLDFMTAAQIASVRSRAGDVECTDAVNAAFAHAQDKIKTVYFPNGVYLVGNLIFGSQNVAGQSSAPVGMIGQSKAATVLKGRPGLTGTLLKSWSLAGVTFRDFAIDTSGTRAQAWDARWRPNDPNRSGPSTQNTIQDIIVTGTPTLAKLPGQLPVTPQVNFDDLNDTYPTNVTVRITDPSHKTCAISFVGSGGLIALVGCIWTGGYLRWGCQNGEMLHSWGTGIEFARGCLNTTTIMAGYPYDNATRKAVYWSESYENYQAIKSLTLIGCQIGTLHADSCYFDLNLYSTVNVIGCEFVGPATVLLGPKTRPGSFASARIKLDGGHHTGNLVVTDVAGVVVTADNFISDATGKAVTKDWRGTFTPLLYGGAGGDGTLVSGSYGRWLRVANIVHYQMRLSWSRHPGAGGAAIIKGLPFEAGATSIGNVTLEFRGGTVPANVSVTIGGGVIVFYQDGAQYNLPATGDIILSGSYTVEA